MKKTIAKIMAAAMVLSAVPAVAAPTLTAKAAVATTPSVASSAAEDSDGNAVIDASGSTGIYLGTDADISTQVGSLAAPTATSSKDVLVAIKTDDSAASGTTNTLQDVLNISVSKSGYLTLSANTKISDYQKVILNAVNTGNTAVAIRIYSDSYGTTKTKVGTLGVSANSSYYDATRYFAGASDSTGTISENVEANEGTLRSGDIHVKLTSTTEPEVEVLKGDSDGILDSNDALRGQLLDLDYVWVGGFRYKVVRIGAQALKKAHMKKFQAQNVTRVGKGALRNAKNVTKVDISDSNKVRKIHSKAFYSCKNLKTILIDGRKLNTVGSGAFSGVKKNCTIKIKAKKTKYNSDVKLIKKSGASNVKFTRVAP